MTKDKANEWIDNNFYGDLSEEEMIENLKAMVSRIYKTHVHSDLYIELQEKNNNGRQRYESTVMQLDKCSEMTTKQALIIKSFDSEGIYETNEQGYITELPQFGKFGANKKIEIFSKEAI